MSQEITQIATPTPPNYDDLLVGLNPQQVEAVQTIYGSLLVLAGAGTGKTKVLTSRIANIIAQGAARSWEILSVTFTNKAAREMNERIGVLIGSETGLSWAGTFHSICAKILRRHAELVGLQSSNFTILNNDDQERLLKQILEADNVDVKKNPAKLLLAIIDGWKNKALLPENLTAGDIPDLYNGKAADYYLRYQNRLRTLNAVDFGDLLLLCITLFRKFPEILTDYHRRFKFISVDEYQDTNVAQYLWLRLLAQGHGNICCVGDDDQSIYAWRGAEVGNILKFEQDFNNAKIIRLEQNYRSTPTILRAASEVIAHNSDRLGKTLFSELVDDDKITITSHWDGDEEARLMVDKIEDLQKFDSIPLNNMAILV
ncbi:MAG: DNA helicase-2/ATP-dependent DNA helicase PcrA, partial [Alphaproteobacteria bacterium]